MDISTFLGNKIIDHLLRNQAYTPPVTVYVSAHTADPGLTGGSEVAGAGYARQALALTAGASKATATSAQVQIPMPSAGGPFLCSWYGIWDASTAGNFLLKVPMLGTNQIVTGAAATDLLTCYAHGFTTGDRISFDAGPGAGLPTGLATATLYWVIATGLTADVFSVSTTSGGAAVNITADGEAIARKQLEKTMNATDLLQINSGALTVTF